MHSKASNTRHADTAFLLAGSFGVRDVLDRSP
jgi:hypothetical protein